MKQPKLNPHLQELINQLRETGEYSEEKLQDLSNSSPYDILNERIRWEGFINYTDDIISWTRGYWEEQFKQEQAPIRKAETKIHDFLVNLLDEKQLQQYQDYLLADDEED